jgi:hypothetical protein
MTKVFKPAASVMYDELVGTAAADFPDSLRELMRYAGVGPDWVVVALEMDGSYRSSWGAVLAVPLPPEGRHVNWSDFADRHDGIIPVRRFPVRHADLRSSVPQGLGLFTQLKRWSVRLVIPGLEGLELAVMVDD